MELDQQVQGWIINCINPNATIQSIERLQGGISSIVHSISLVNNGILDHYVVRQFNNKKWLEDEPDLVAHESESLRLATQADVPTPEIIACDQTGAQCGLPTVLMTKLNGRVDLQPLNRSDWLNGLAEALLKIHSVTVGSYPWSYRPYMNIDHINTPQWSTVPEVWNIAIDLIKQPQPSFRPSFIHRDYHPTNILWNNGKVSGVVDWVNACRGPVGIDLGHCRWNLALLSDVSTADTFLSAYEQLAGSGFKYDPYWDILPIMDILFEPPTVYPGWTALGVTGLTDELIRKRLDNYIISILRRAGRL